MIKLVIFDGEGVLYSARKMMKIFLGEYDKFLKNLGVNPKKTRRAFSQA